MENIIDFIVKNLVGSDGSLNSHRTNFKWFDDNNHQKILNLIIELTPNTKILKNKINVLLLNGGEKCRNCDSVYSERRIKI